MIQAESSLQQFPSHLKSRCAWACRVANVRLVGFQSGFGVAPDLLLFNPVSGPAQGTTLSLELARVSPVAIAHKVMDASLLFKKAASR